MPARPWCPSARSAADQPSGRRWGDIVYPINTQLTSKLQFSDLRISAGYSIFKTRNKEVGVGLDVRYHPFRHVGFGLGYRSMFMNFEDTGSKLTARLNQSLQGPGLFLTASF